MTIRSGGRPRDGRAAATRYDPEAYATETIPEFSEPVNRGRGGRGGGGGHGLVGFLKFLVFALVLAVFVLAVALTALRPAISSTIMSIAEDNPGALQIPFVKDIVQENLGAALTTPASTDPTRSNSRSRTAIRRNRSRGASRTRASWPTAGRSSSTRSIATSRPVSSRARSSCART
jgi:hypothetical protein